MNYHKKVTFWDAPQANKAPPSLNQSNQVLHPGVHPQPNQALFNAHQSNRATNNTHTTENEPIHAQNKQKTRRGKRKGTSKLIRRLKVMTINTRGIKNKITSITSALHTNNTHIAAITETHLNGNEDVKIRGYQWIGQNRPHKGGGIGFLVRNDTKDLIEERKTPPSTNLESKWITLKGANKITIAVVYGKQETAIKEEVEYQFQELTTLTNRMQQKGEVIIMGDLNAKVEINSHECKQKESRNGNILQEYIRQTNTIILNKTENHQGTWTRVNRKNNNERSVIDYIITSRPL